MNNLCKLHSLKKANYSNETCINCIYRMDMNNLCKLHSLKKANYSNENKNPYC